jgi:uncharacterized protein YbjT (DUF2867 family)
MSKIIAVFGSTGNQGGAVLKSLLKAGNYHVRAITRNANSDKAKKLAALNNVTVHEADFKNPDSLDKVLAGAYGAFFVTDFSAHFDHSEVNKAQTLLIALLEIMLNMSCLVDLRTVKNIFISRFIISITKKKLKIMP